MDKRKINKIYKEVKSLNPELLSEVRDKLIPIFLNLEKSDPFEDKNVIKLLKRRYSIALKEKRQSKLTDAFKYLKKSIG